MMQKKNNGRQKSLLIEVFLIEYKSQKFFSTVPSSQLTMIATEKMEAHLKQSGKLRCKRPYL